MTDKINDAIWFESPARQRSIQPPECLAAPGAVGAQQAMVSADDILPWVPDLLCENWIAPETILIVGSAYAGFIREFSLRTATMPLGVYRTAGIWQEFQERFIEYVVRPDQNYYGPLTRLGGGTLRNLVLLDLCRASFVQRGAASGPRRDESKDSILNKNAATYSRYVDIQADWTWQRIVESRARRIVALGSIAEHGLLRLFTKRGATIAEADRTVSIKSRADNVWPLHYAVRGRTFGYWLDHQTWWTVTHTVNGQKREWKVLPTLHPARMHDDPGYMRTAKLLHLMRE